ncbi:MAG: tRNA (adenosine(37)-N6)-threonylcarbamoyltransferase complex dimerization subunit type 1 TsaB, partial [Thermodesulfobacteriota bacterium]
ADALVVEVEEASLLAGDGLASYGDYLCEQLGQKITLAPRLVGYPSAASLGLLAAERLRAGDVLDLESAAPLYVRASDAELSLLKKEEQGRKGKS